MERTPPITGTKSVLRERVLELEADVVERGLGVVKEHKLPDSERGKLAAELGVYRPGGR